MFSNGSSDDSSRLRGKLYETAVWTVCRRALAGKTTTQRDIYRALNMQRYYPDHEAMLRDIMMQLCGSKYVQMEGRNRSGWGIFTASEAGLEFYRPIVGALSK